MATLEAPKSRAKPFPKKGKGPASNKPTDMPSKSNVAASNRSTRRGSNLLTNTEQHQELPVLSNHTITFVQAATQPKPKKPLTASSLRPRGTPNRRVNNDPINMGAQQPLTSLSNHTITFVETSVVGTANNHSAVSAPPPETSTRGKGEEKKKAKVRKTYKERPPVDRVAQSDLVTEAALTVTEIFRKHGISCAVFGSLASKLYGCVRTPKDVDMLVSQQRLEDNSDGSQSASGGRPPLDAESLKDLILRTNSHNFYLKMPRNPEATYRILWYRRDSRSGPECKVDILVPGVMHLPHLRPERVVWRTNVPLVPYSLLLLQKLQGWDDHCKAEEAHYRRKHPQDAADVRRLLGLTEFINALKHSFCLDDEELFTPEFRALTVERVKSYCEIFPDRAERWKMIGFETS